MPSRRASSPIFSGIWLAPGGRVEPLSLALPNGVYGILHSAGLVFFAFAGYARNATLGEEVRDPARTIPRTILRAILGALAIAVAVYALVGWTTLLAAGPQRLAVSTAPLTEAATVSGATWLVPVVQLGAVVASLGALLTLLAGVGRTMLAMARNAAAAVRARRDRRPGSRTYRPGAAAQPLNQATNHGCTPLRVPSARCSDSPTLNHETLNQTLRREGVKPVAKGN